MAARYLTDQALVNGQGQLRLVSSWADNPDAPGRLVQLEWTHATPVEAVDRDEDGWLAHDDRLRDQHGDEILRSDATEAAGVAPAMVLVSRGRASYALS